MQTLHAVANPVVGGIDHQGAGLSGLLHLRIFTGEELIPALFSTLANPETSPNIIDGVSSWFEITAPHEMTFNLDGEPLSGKTFRMEILPAALRCRLPPDCVLLR